MLIDMFMFMFIFLFMFMFILTKRYRPLHGPTYSSCRGLWPLATAFFALRGKKEHTRLFLPILGNVWCSVVTLVIFSSNLSNFEKNKKKIKKIKSKIQKVQKYQRIKKKSKKFQKSKIIKNKIHKNPKISLKKTPKNSIKKT